MKSMNDVSGYLQKTIRLFIFLLFGAMVIGSYSPKLQSFIYCQSYPECRVYSDPMGFIALTVGFILFGYMGLLSSYISNDLGRLIKPILFSLSIGCFLLFFGWFISYDRVTPRSYDSVMLGLQHSLDLANGEGISVEWKDEYIASDDDSQIKECIPTINLLFIGEKPVPFNILDSKDIGWFSEQTHLPVREITDGRCSLATAKKNNQNIGWIKVGMFLSGMYYFIDILISVIHGKGFKRNS